jgi:hypothetical protein
VCHTRAGPPRPVTKPRSGDSSRSRLRTVDEKDPRVDSASASQPRRSTVRPPRAAVSPRVTAFAEARKTCKASKGVKGLGWVRFARLWPKRLRGSHSSSAPKSALDASCLCQGPGLSVPCLRPAPTASSNAVVVRLQQSNIVLQEKGRPWTKKKARQICQ